MSLAPCPVVRCHQLSPRIAVGTFWQRQEPAGLHDKFQCRVEGPLLGLPIFRKLLLRAWMPIPFRRRAPVRYLQLRSEYLVGLSVFITAFRFVRLVSVFACAFSSRPLLGKSFVGLPSFSEALSERRSASENSFCLLPIGCGAFLSPSRRRVKHCFPS